MDNDLLTPREVSEMLRVTRWTLARWRMERRYMDYVKAGKTVYYKRDDVQKFINAYFKTVKCPNFD